MALAPLHSSVGMALIKIIPNKILGFAAAILSHIILDKYPESSTSFRRPSFESRVNIAGQIILTFFMLYMLTVAVISKEEKLWLIAGAVGSILFDIIEAVNVVFFSSKRIFFFHRGEYQKFSMGPVQNIILDATFVIILTILIFA